MASIDTPKIYSSSIFVFKYYQNLNYQISFERCSGKTLSEDEFWQLKEELALSHCFGKKRGKEQSVEGEKRENVGQGIHIEESDAMTELIRNRYQSIADGSLNCLLFIHIKKEKGFEMSGHIDLTQR